MKGRAGDGIEQRTLCGCIPSGGVGGSLLVEHYNLHASCLLLMVDVPRTLLEFIEFLDLTCAQLHR